MYGPRLGAVVAAAARRRRAAEATEAPEATDAAHAAHAAPVDVVAPIDVAPAEAAPALLLMGFEQAALGRGRQVEVDLDTYIGLQPPPRRVAAPEAEAWDMAGAEAGAKAKARARARAKAGEAYRVDHVEACHHRAQVVVGGEGGLGPEVREEAWQRLGLGLGWERG